MEYLPEVFKEFQRQFPEVAKLHDELALKCLNWGPLDAKAKRLVKLGISVGLNAEGAVRSHARRALEEGITADEVRHTVLLSFTTAGFPTMIASLKWINEVIEKHK